MIWLILLFALLMAPAVNMEARDFSVGSFEELTNAISQCQQWRQDFDCA